VPAATSRLVAEAGRTALGVVTMLDAPLRGRPAVLRVLVAVTRATDRQRLCRILDRAGGFTVVAEAQDGSAAVRVSRQVEPDLVLLDMAIPGLCAIDATPAIVHAAPATTIVLLTPAEGGDAGAGLAMRYGARGQVRIDSSGEALLAALDAALSHELTGREARPQQVGITPPPWWEALSTDG
jgi:DNA-binding NarL/FixJ family response regulator